MKFDRSKTFPYPVLRPYSDDYVDVEFQALAEFLIDGSDIKVHCSYLTSSIELQQQIALGTAKYVSIISCRETYLREIVATSETAVEVSIDADSLKGAVAVDAYIVATKTIKNYGSPDINKEFGKKRFDFLPGEILAQDETQCVYIDRDLFKPISSVFELVKNDALTGGEWRVSLEQDQVRIEVSSAMKESIDNSRSSNLCKSVLINSIYFSSVVHAVQRLKDGGEYEDLKWAKVMIRQIHNAHIDINATDAYVIAQKLMKHPLSVLNMYVFSGAENA
ncbi:hypothetical protein LK540_23775 [Massilia sp. IC2-278]|uniref:hypothetical protein n=1 Tax=Massilia sp. IC2-278 TaxID=2887200 RepID=UPI001E51C24F|nr:hypothetical protein [Massilia sp. IC2-278]MCC2963462.1 hypothetical protein [Massilia sp. IC2-278]